VILERAREPVWVIRVSEVTLVRATTAEAGNIARRMRKGVRTSVEQGSERDIILLIRWDAERT
jgi:hypothetical protein